MVTAHAVTAPQTRATSPSFLGFRPDDLVVGNFGLAQFVAEGPVSLVAYEGFLLKFLFYRGVDLQVVPFVLQDLFEVG